MNLIIIAALVAATLADKLDRTYLPPPSAKSAGGSPGSLQTPFASNSLNGGLGSLPKGSYTNEFQGVVVDAVAPGTRASGTEESGLGAPRISYGSINSKVGAAAFKTNPSAFGQASVAEGTDVESIDQGFVNQAPGSATPERLRASIDRAANTVKFDSQVGPESYSYSFETDNGIVAEENGIGTNGVQAQGGFSYTGDDGQVYTVTYTADEGGYQPKGDHLPTPPPIPEEILKSLEKNAKDEAAGLVDDGSYDAQKYNTGGDYADNGDTNGKYSHQSSKFGGAGETDVTASGSFISQNNQFSRPGHSSQSAQVLGSGNKVEKYQAVPVQGNSGFSGQLGSSQSGQAFENENKGHADSDGQSGHSQENNGFTGHFGSSHFGHGASVSGTSQHNEETSESPAFTKEGISRPNGNDAQSGFNSNRFGQISSFSSNSNQNNRFNNNNEYLPPINSFGQNRPQNRRPGFQNGPQFNTYEKSESEQSFPTNVPGIKSQGSISAPKPDANRFSGQFGLQQKQGSSLNQPSNDAQSSSSGNTFGQSHELGKKFQGLPQNQPFNNARPSSNSDTFGQSQNFGNILQQNQGSTETETSDSPRPSTSGATFGQTQDFGNKLQQNQALTSQASKNPRPSASGTIFGQSQGFGNKFGSKNEYLPPSNNFGLNNNPAQKQFNNQYNQQYNSNPQFSANLPSSQSQQQEFFSNSFSSSNPTQQSSFGFTSQSKPQNNRLNYSPTSVQPQFTASSPGIQTASQQSQPGQFQSQFNAQKATSQPDTELTTPLETSGTQNTHDAFSTASINSRPTQSTFGASASANTGSFGFQSTPRPQKIGSRPFGIRPQPTAFSNKPASNQYQQFQTNSQFGTTSSFSQDNDVQGAPSTPNPTFAQQAQGPDDSYYYRQPSKPFGTPQGPRFPSAPSNQFNIAQKRPQNNQFVAKQPQSSQFQGSSSSKYPTPPSVAPTSSSQSQFHSNSFSNQYNGITQASISPFPSQAPTQPTQFNQQGQFGRPGNKPMKPNQAQSRPTFGQTSMTQASFSQTTATPFVQKPERRPIFQTQQSLTNQPEPTETASQTTPTQQYNGELYEYNKPAEVVPAPENNEQSGSAMFGQNEQPSRPQPGPENDNSLTSTAQFAQAQSPRPFGASRPQFGQKIQQSGFVSENTVQATSQPQFSQNFASTSSQDQSNAQNSPVETQFGAKIQEAPSPCCQGPQQSGSLPSSLRPLQGFGSQGQAQFGQNSFPGSQGLRPGAAVSSFAGKGEQFGGPRQPPSFDEKTGYHY